MLGDFALEIVAGPGAALTVTLPGIAPAGRMSWGSQFTTSQPVYYILDDTVQLEWGYGAFTAGSPNTISRDQVIGNSAGTTVKLDFERPTRCYSAWPAESLEPGLSADKGRNMFDNPTFTILQRGAGPFAAAGGTFTMNADRWHQQAVTNTLTVNLVTLTDTDRTAIGDEEATTALQAAVTGTSGAGDYAYVGQRIESVRRTNGKFLTVSFWAKASSGTPKLGIQAVQNFGAGGTAPPPPGSQSADGTKMPPTSPLIDKYGASWTLTAGGGSLAKNGTTDGATSGLAYAVIDSSGVLYYQTAAGAWFLNDPNATPSPWVATTTPPSQVGVVTVPNAPTVARTAHSSTSFTATLTPAGSGSLATSWQWQYRTPPGGGTAGGIAWGAVGHRDQGGAYTSISIAQQATDLKNLFGTGLVIFRGVGETQTAAQSGADLTAYQAAGIEPVIEVTTYPPFATFADQPAAYNWAFATVAPIVAATLTAKYYEIGNEWTINSPTNTYTGDGSLPAHWTGQPYFARMVGAVAGAVAAIRAGNPSAKILCGCTGGWTQIGLPVAMAQSLATYGGTSAWQWSTTHKSTDIILSNNNQTGTTGATPGPNGDIGYANNSIPAGSLKYWEVTVSGSPMANVGAGIGNTASTVASGDWLGDTANAIGWYGSGGVSTNNATAATWASFTTGATLCFALDRIHNKIWGRVGAAGNWNNDVLANQNPATNTGGYTIPAAVYANPVVPGYAVSHTGDAAVARFTPALWIGTPPAGFSAPDDDRTWDNTVLHWYNDVVGGNQMGMPDNFAGGLNAYTLLKGAGKPLFITEFGSSNGNNTANDAACGAALSALMDNFILHQPTTSTEPGVAGATIYQMYQQSGQTNYKLYNYTSGSTGSIAPQGTAIKGKVSASAYTTAPATGTTMNLTGLPSSTAYGVRAAGVNSAGTGTPSAEVSMSTDAAGTASPDGTIIPPATQIIMADLTVVTVSGGVIYSGGATLGFSASVTQVGVFNGGILFQINSAGSVYYWTGSTWINTATNPFAAPPPAPTITTLMAGATPGITMNNGHILTCTSGGDVQDNGVNIPNGGGTAEVAYDSAIDRIYGKDSGGSGWYYYNPSITNWVSCPDPTTAISPPPPVGTGVFTVTAAGGFRDSNGNAWSMRGLNGGPQDCISGFNNVFAQFPGTTCIRLNCNSNSDEDAMMRQVVSQYTSRGCVVMIEDHWSGNPGNTAWYAKYVALFKSNNLVFFETPNEPNGGSSPQIAVINTIRAGGYTGPIGLQPQGGYDFSSIQAVKDACGTTNIFLTPHIYYGGTDPNGPQAYLDSDISTTLGFGYFPSIDEFGEGVDGVTRDQYGSLVTSTILAANVAGRCGAVYWAMDNGNHSSGVDSAFLTYDGSQLTSTGAGPLKTWLSGTTGGTTGATLLFTDSFASIDQTKWHGGYFWHDGGSAGADCWEVAFDQDPTMNVYVIASDGVHVQVKPTPTPMLSAAGGKHWLVGNLNTGGGRFARQFGYWEVTAKICQNTGMLSAIWLYSDDDGTWPSLEFDITETASYDPTRMHMTTHTTNIITPQDYTTPDERAAFHRYGINCQDAVTEIYFDRTKIRSAATPTSLKGRVYLLLSVYTQTDGSAWWGGPNINAGDPWPDAMVVSNVSVWDKPPF